MEDPIYLSNKDVTMKHRSEWVFISYNMDDQAENEIFQSL